MQDHKKTLELAAQAAHSTDSVVQRDARRLLARLHAIPMSDILAMIPGDNMLQKAASIGVSRTAVWYWHHGYNRPRAKAAKRIAQLTGLSVVAIRGCA